MNLKEFRKKTSKKIHKNSEFLSTTLELLIKSRIFRMMTVVDVTRVESVTRMSFGLMSKRMKRDDTNKEKHDDKNTEKYNDKIKGKEKRSSMKKESSDTIVRSSDSTWTVSWMTGYFHVVND